MGGSCSHPRVGGCELEDDFPWISCVSACLTEALITLCSRLFFQISLYSEHPWKIVSLLRENNTWVYHPVYKRFDFPMLKSSSQVVQLTVCAGVIQASLTYPVETGAWRSDTNAYSLATSIAARNKQSIISDPGISRLLTSLHEIMAS